MAEQHICDIKQLLQSLSFRGLQAVLVLVAILLFQPLRRWHYSMSGYS